MWPYSELDWLELINLTDLINDKPQQIHSDFTINAKNLIMF